MGKSFLIKLLSQWIDYILEEPGDITYYPKVIRLAFTGNAAYLIGKIKLKLLFIIRFEIILHRLKVDSTYNETRLQI